MKKQKEVSYGMRKSMGLARENGVSDVHLNERDEIKKA